MVLQKEKLQELNRYMLGLGAPIERDDIGYNRPDFGLMEGLGRYRYDLNDDMAYAVSERLLHYKNTQLSNIAQDLEETVDFYRKKLVKERPNNYRDFCNSRETRDFIPYQVHALEKVDHSLILTFDDKIFLPNLNLPYWTEVHWEDNNYIKLNVPIKHLLDFMERIKDYGKYGFEPDEKLQNYMTKVKEAMQSGQQKQADTIKIVGKTKDNEAYYLRFTGFVDIKGFMDQENAINPDCLKWKKVNDAVVLQVKRNEIFYLYKKLKELDFFNYQLEQKSQGFVPLSDEERRRNVIAEIAKNDAKNASGLSLIDYTNYSLPFTPYPFQIEDATRIVGNKRMLMGQDMGCGKTMIATLVGTSIDTPKLVIVPESLRINWRKEIRNLTPNANIRILYSKDKFDLNKNHLPDWTIVGYATVNKYSEQLKEMGYNCVFIDEAHNCKAVNNRGEAASARAKAVLELCDQAEYVYPMTGTPIPTRNKDLYNIFRMLKVDKVGDVKMGDKWSFYNYGNKFCNGHNNGFGWECEGNTNSDQLHTQLQPYMVRRLKKDVLPNLTKQRIFIPTETTSREYKEIEKRLHDMGDDETYMGLAMTGRHVLSKEKVKPAIDLAESILSEDKSVVIVSNFNETLDTIVDKFGDDCCTIRGGMSDSAKQQAIDDFQSGRKHVCALNIIAGGVGVTLTKAHDMVICDYDWTPSNMAQVEDRICRAGQTEGCNIHYIYCENSVLDTTFVDMITSKSANIDKVVDGAENTMDLSNGVSFMKALQSRIEGDEKSEKKRMKDDPLFRLSAGILPKLSENHTVTTVDDGFMIDGSFFENDEILKLLSYKKDSTVVKKIDALLEKAQEKEEEVER